MAYKVRQTGQQVQADLDKIEGVEAGAQVNVQSDWNESDPASDAYIKNKPNSISQVQSDWSQSDTTAVDYIKNKPTIPVVPTNVSAFTNDAGYLTQHQDLSSLADGAEYDSNEKRIYLKHGNVRLANPIDATAFIKDGMVESVAVSNGYLVITFNTDSGKQPISIPLRDIFNANNYYTKSEVDTALGAKQGKPIEISESYFNLFQALANSSEDNPVTLSGDALNELNSLEAAYTGGQTFTFMGTPMLTEIDNWINLQIMNFDSLMHNGATTKIEIHEEDGSCWMDGAHAEWQKKLTFDNIPTQNSNNPVKSGGIYTALQNIDIENVTEVTWAELKGLRDNGELVKGNFYRITDYNCTTTQENTQSAGHQFDIVLLALSENKLAEEGWAMEHPTDVWDIQLHNGVVKKGYLYFDHTSPREGDMYNIVIAETLMGEQIASQTLNIDEENKIIHLESYNEDFFEQEGLTYSYFQNSNLSAWKVWYCLDNDITRFAWADDSVDVEFSFIGTFNGNNCIVTEQNIASSAKVDGTIYYKFKTEGSGEIWVNTLDIEIGSKTYSIGGPSSHLIAIEVGEILSIDKKEQFSNGRGVIYRLIDEWGNDVGYDFKNIMYQLPLTDGIYDADNGTGTWVYTFSDTYEGEMRDLTMYNSYDEEQGFMIYVCCDNKLTFLHTSLPNNIIYANDLEVQADLFGGGVPIYQINICGENNKIIGDPFAIEAKGLTNSTLINVVASTFGYECNALELSDVDSLNYGNGGVELVADSDYVHTDNNYTSAEKTKLAGIASGAEVNVQSDWNQSDSSADDFIKNKPTIPDAQIQADWNQATTTAKDYIKNKPTIPTVPTNVSAFTNDAGYLNGNFCPIIEDTRSSAVAAITGNAPFASLETGQKILLHLAYNTASNATLNLTLSDGTTTTGTKTMKIAYNASFVDVGTGYTYIAGCYIPLIYNGTNWRVTGRENDTTYSSMTQANINSGTATTNTVSAKLLHDNAYIVEETYTSGSLTANKFYDFGTVSSALTIPSLDATNDLVSNALNFYALRFIAGADNISITFPTGVVVDDTPTINTGDYVEIMINLYVENSTNHFYASIKVWQAQ